MSKRHPEEQPSGGGVSEQSTETVSDGFSTEIIRTEIQRYLQETEKACTVTELAENLSVAERVIEDNLEVLTRERALAVDERNGELVFSVDAPNRDRVEYERGDFPSSKRVYEVVPAESPEEGSCLKLVEKRQWEDGYEHVVGAVVIPQPALDVVFSMLDGVDKSLMQSEEA